VLFLRILLNGVAPVGIFAKAFKAIVRWVKLTHNQKSYEGQRFCPVNLDKKTKDLLVAVSVLAVLNICRVNIEV